MRSDGTLPPAKFRIQYGVTRLDESNTYHELSQVIVHEEYRKPQRYNDIALLNLKNPVEYSPSTRPVCLPTQEKMGNQYCSSLTGKSVTVVGWGAKTYDEPEETNELQEVVVQVVDLNECDRNYSGIYPILS